MSCESAANNDEDVECASVSTNKLLITLFKEVDAFSGAEELTMISKKKKMFKETNINYSSNKSNF